MPASSSSLLIDTPRTDLASCRALLAGGSRSFRIASFLLPGAVGDAACQLYAFCREADDLIDEGDDPGRALAVLEARITAIYQGQPGPSSIDRSLCEVVSRYHMPRNLLDALLEGFAWDADGRRYATLSDVLDYSARVAGSVGVMMTLLMGERCPQVLARAADLGAAMQLTNIARDVGEDARAGRLYLPLAWLTEAGIDPEEFLNSPHHSEALARVIKRLLNEADRLYKRADNGIRSLPRGCRPGIYAARLLYHGIGVQLARQDYDAVSLRAVVPNRAKLSLMARAARAGALPDDQLSDPPLAQTKFLIPARDSAPETLPESAARSGFNGRLAWMLELFEAMDARDRAAALEHRLR
ncbi:MAG: phytoene/squalene synthase family protein [Pseudomonadota bacterium]